MVKIREYKSRKAADSASSYLMSKGIPAVIKGYVVVPKALEHLKDSMVELTVPEHLFDKAKKDTYLNMKAELKITTKNNWRLYEKKDIISRIYFNLNDTFLFQHISW